ncbi:hypothetical protein Tco_1553987 [Tanacetum coccineum]
MHQDEYDILRKIDSKTDEELICLQINYSDLELRNVSKKGFTSRSGLKRLRKLALLVVVPFLKQETEETTDKEQSIFQGSTAQIPPSVTPIPTPKPDVPKTLPNTTPIPESDVPKSLPKPHIPYPSRLNQEKSRDKALNQKEKIFQMFTKILF